MTYLIWLIKLTIFIKKYELQDRAKNKVIKVCALGILTFAINFLK